MKKILLGILLVMLAVSCVNKPDTVVSKFIDNIKEKKIEEASKYTVNSEAFENIGLKYDNKVQEALFESLFKNMKYKVISSEKKDKDTTIVTVEVENVDTYKVFVKIFTKMAKEFFATSIEEEFHKILESKDIPISKNTTQFIVVKTDKGNKIELTPENIDVLFGKINTTLSNLNNLDDSGESQTNEQNSSVENQNSSSSNSTNNMLQEGPSAGKDQKLPEPAKK